MKKVAKKSAAPATRKRATSYRQIAAGLRGEIISGKLPVGSKCPSTREVAATWQASVFTAHKAMVTLVKEGWLERAHGEGTFVADPHKRFLCAGIYHGSDLCANEQNGFLRRIHTALLEQFRALNKETLVFIDTRPEDQQATVLPSLAEAIANRRIQCLVIPTVTSVNSPALGHLTLPVASLSFPFRGRIEYDMENFMKDSVRAVAQMGCKSVGLIASLFFSEARGFPYEKFYTFFEEAVRRERLMTRPEWIRKPSRMIDSGELERYGYTEFEKLWKLKEKPEGVIVYPDWVVRGVVAAVLDAGRDEVARQMRFVFHRNAHLDFLCPVAATWAVTDEDRLAAGLIEQVQRQLRGEKIGPLLLRPAFVESRGMK